MSALVEFAKPTKLNAINDPAYPAGPVIRCAKDGAVITEGRNSSLVAGAFKGSPPAFLAKAPVRVRTIGYTDRSQREVAEYTVTFDPRSKKAVVAILRLAKPEGLVEADQRASNERSWAGRLRVKVPVALTNTKLLDLDDPMESGLFEEVRDSVTNYSTALVAQGIPKAKISQQGGDKGPGISGEFVTPSRPLGRPRHSKPSKGAVRVRRYRERIREAAELAASKSP
jgi:hypothetical protein